MKTLYEENEKLRSHHATDSEIKREIIALKRRRKDEKKENIKNEWITG